MQTLGVGLVGVVRRDDPLSGRTALFCGVYVRNGIAFSRRCGELLSAIGGRRRFAPLYFDVSFGMFWT